MWVRTQQQGLNNYLAVPISGSNKQGGDGVVKDTGEPGAESFGGGHMGARQM